MRKENFQRDFRLCEETESKVPTSSQALQRLPTKAKNKNGSLKTEI